MIAPARQRPRSEERRAPHLPKPTPIRNLAITNRRPMRWPAALSRSKGSRTKGGRNARATRTRSRAFQECPPAIHPREPPVAAGSTTIIQQAAGAHVFAAPTLSLFLPPRNKKSCPACAEAVDDGTSLWKREENLAVFPHTALRTVQLWMTSIKDAVSHRPISGHHRYHSEPARSVG
jgi:hypothetical protein